MALQAGVQTSKVLILLGAGLTGSIVLRNGKLSEVIFQLQELLKGVDEVEFLPNKYDPLLLAAQIRQLAQEIKELSLSNPITVINGNSSSNGVASYLVPAAALGAIGYCYMWWKGLSFSDVIFVTKKNMAEAVANVSKQLEHVSEALTSTKRHLSKRLETLDWKVDEQKETSQLIANNVNDMKSNLSQIGLNVDMIHQMVAGLEGKIELLESKQDVANAGLWYLCQFAEGVKDGVNANLFQDTSAKLGIESAAKFEGTAKGLQFLAETDEFPVDEKPVKSSKDNDVDLSVKKVANVRTRIHRSYPVGVSWARDVMGSDT